MCHFSPFFLFFGASDAEKCVIFGQKMALLSAVAPSNAIPDGDQKTPVLGQVSVSYPLESNAHHKKEFQDS